MNISEAVDETNNVGTKKLLDVAFDRLRNNFYGYILTSLVFFNLENIILIIKSKNSIEMTLIYIGLQKDFSWNFFWVPIFYGMLASVLMPVITAVYALSTGVIKAVRDESGLFGSEIWGSIKFKVRSYCKKEESKIDMLKRELKHLHQNRNDHFDFMEAAYEQREAMEAYLIKLANIYGIYNNNNSERDLVGFLREVERADIAQYLPNPQQLKDLNDFVNRQTNGENSNQVRNKHDNKSSSL